MKFLTDPRLQGWAHLATIIGVTVGAGALVVTAIQADEQANQAREQAKQFSEQTNQFRDQVSLTREVAQYQAWRVWMDKIDEKPEWSFGIDFGKLSRADQIKYIWYVERLLFAGEEILWYTPKDYQWESTVKFQLSYHKSYLESSEFVEESFCDYTSPIRKIIVQVSSAARLKNKSCAKDYRLAGRRPYNE